MKTKQTAWAVSFVLFSAFVLAGQVLASDDGSQGILTVSQEGDASKTLSLSVIVNSAGDVQKIQYRAAGAAAPTGFAVNQLGRGIALYEVDTPVGKKEAVKLQSNSFSPKNGGTITVDYLVDGALVVAQRAKKEIELSPAGSGKWVLSHLDSNGARKQFTRAVVAPKYKNILFKRTMVGVESINFE